MTTQIVQMNMQLSIQVDHKLTTCPYDERLQLYAFEEGHDSLAWLTDTVAMINIAPVVGRTQNQ